MSRHQYRRAGTIHGQFAWWVARTPDAVALVHGERRVTYRELDRLSGSYAAALQGHGVTAGRLVPVLLPRTVEMVAALLGILKAGGAYAALDPRWPRERLAHLLSEVDGPVLVSDTDGFGLPCWTPGAPDDRVPEPVGVDSADPAVLFFTSGSTGAPKGVLLPHSGTARLFDDCGFEPFGPDVVQAQSMPTHWDGSILDLWSALLCGGTSVFVDEVMQPALLRRLIRDDGVNGAGFLPGAVFNMIVDEDLDAFAGLRFLGIGGERLSPTHVARFLARHPEIALTNIYGPVESTALVTAHRITPADVGAADGIPLGRPVTASGVHVLDGERGCLPGEVGELCLSGDGLALRYLGNPELTAQRFVTVSVDGVPTRVYRTGDLGYVDTEGVYHYRGRNDRQVKINGHRIEPGEIERTAERVPGVLRAAVVPVPGPDGTPHSLALCYVADPDRPADPDDLAATLRRRLPAYLVPRSYTALDRLPLNANGKIDRGALAALVAPAGTDTPGAPEDAGQEGTPRAVLLGAFRDLTGIRPAGDESFFDLGGDSLDAARLCARISTALGVAIPVSQVYRTPTVDALLDWLAAAPAVAGQPAGAATASGVIPLATGQANYVGATGSTICVVTWWVDGPLAVDTLAAALGDVHRRHQALHAAYRTAPPGATLPARPGAPALQVLSGVGDDATALAAVNAALLEPLDVAAGRVWRAVVAPAGGRHLVGVGIHHIAFDGYSEEILARELSQAYAARAAGTAPAWSAPAPTLAELANRSTARMRPDDLARQSRYWQRQLRDLPRLRLPGAPRGPVPPAGPTAGIRLPIPAEVFAPWDARARQRRVSQFSYLVAVFGEVLRELTGQRDVGVLVPMSLRGDPLLDAAITCRANPVVLRLRPAPEGGDAWATTATAVGEALAAQDLPFGEVVGAVARVRPDLDALLNLPIFVVQDRQEEQLTLPGCAVHRIADRQAADVPSVLAIDLALTAAGADLNVGVRTDLVDLTFAERVGEAYQRILAAGPDAFSRRHAGAGAALVAG